MKKIKNIIQIIIFLAAAVTLWLKTYSILGFSQVHSIENPLIQSAVIIGMQFVIFLESLLLVYIFAKFIDKVKLSEIGVAVNKKGLRIFLIGTILAVFAGIITWLAFLLINKPVYTCKINSFWIIFLVAILMIPAGFFQATAEEFIFRSWALKKLGETITPAGAIIVIGLTFGGIHLLNPKYSFFAVLNATLFGFVASLAYFRTKSVWMAAGIHFGWNYILSGVIYNLTFFKVSYKGQDISMFDGAEATFTGCLTVILIGIIVFYITRQEKIRGEKV